MTISPILLVHIGAGFISILAGAVALFSRKGSPLHKKTGKVFVISMLFMSAGGAYLALMKSQMGNVFGGVMTFYMVATAWLTVLRRERETGRLEYGLLLVVLAACITGVILGLGAAQSPTGEKDGNPAGAYFAFATLAGLSGAGDIRMLLRGGLAGAQRIARHLWRMCVAFFISAGSFFLGTSNNPLQLRARLFTPAIRRTHLPEVPLLIIVVMMIFWLCRLLFTRVYRTPAPRQPLPGDEKASRQLGLST